MRRSQAVPARRASPAVRAVRALLASALLVVAAIVLSGLWHAGAVPDIRAAVAPGPAMTASVADAMVEDDESGSESATLATAPPLLPQAAAPRATRIPRPVLPTGPRRVGIQAGHWRTTEAPPELGRILTQTGTSWDDIDEWAVNLDIAQRVATLLRAKGLLADVLWTAVPPGYLADAFVALHVDGEASGEKSGFKLAHSSRRTPFEDALQRSLTDAYAEATHLEYDQAGITNNMRNYYALSWSRIRYATSPFTPSVVLEMGFLSNDDDRSLLVETPEVAARAIASGLLRFLDANPRELLFGKDLLVPPPPTFRPRPT